MPPPPRPGGWQPDSAPASPASESPSLARRRSARTVYWQLEIGFPLFTPSRNTAGARRVTELGTPGPGVARALPVRSQAATVAEYRDRRAGAVLIVLHSVGRDCRRTDSGITESLTESPAWQGLTESDSDAGMQLESTATVTVTLA